MAEDDIRTMLFTASVGVSGTITTLALSVDAGTRVLRRAQYVPSLATVAVAVAVPTAALAIGSLVSAALCTAAWTGGNALLGKKQS